MCLRDQINLRLLRQMTYDLLDHLFILPGVEPGQSEDVFCTLLNPKHLPKGETLPVTLSSDRTITFGNILDDRMRTIDNRQKICFNISTRVDMTNSVTRYAQYHRKRS